MTVWDALDQWQSRLTTPAPEHPVAPPPMGKYLRAQYDRVEASTAAIRNNHRPTRVGDYNE